MKIYAPIPVTISVTVILVLYNIFIVTGAASDIVTIIFCISPLLMIWLVLAIIKKGNYTGRDLDSDEHWGYQDRDSETMGTF